MAAEEKRAEKEKRVAEEKHVEEEERAAEEKHAEESRRAEEPILVLIEQQLAYNRDLMKNKIDRCKAAWVEKKVERKAANEAMDIQREAAQYWQLRNTFKNVQNFEDLDEQCDKQFQGRV